MAYTIQLWPMYKYGLCSYGLYICWYVSVESGHGACAHACVCICTGMFVRVGIVNASGHGTVMCVDMSRADGA